MKVVYEDNGTTRVAEGNFNYHSDTFLSVSSAGIGTTENRVPAKVWHINKKQILKVETDSEECASLVLGLIHCPVCGDADGENCGCG